MTITKVIDWQSLNGKSLKIIVAEPNNTVIGIDEESGKSYVLHQEQPMMLRTFDIEPTKRRGWL
ncbi:hypothetical protein [Psychrobacillus sp. FSL H8-0487]|uniref:hypothetical protein n=1 Tax=Psychrobacillus sp. FSL H8-0487 TaxID=2921391 RepID=UPI0030F547E0